MRERGIRNGEQLIDGGGGGIRRPARLLHLNRSNENVQVVWVVGFVLSGEWFYNSTSISVIFAIIWLPEQMVIDLYWLGE